MCIFCLKITLKGIYYSTLNTEKTQSERGWVTCPTTTWETHVFQKPRYVWFLQILRSASMTWTPLQHGETLRTEVRRSHPRVVLSYVVMMQVSINRWMAKQNVAYQNNGILFSHKRNEILTCYNTHESWKQYAKRKKPDIKEHRWFHFC